MYHASRSLMTASCPEFNQSTPDDKTKVGEMVGLLGIDVRRIEVVVVLLDLMRARIFTHVLLSLLKTTQKQHEAFPRVEPAKGCIVRLAQIRFGRSVLCSLCDRNHRWSKLVCHRRGKSTSSLCDSNHVREWLTCRCEYDTWVGEVLNR